MDDDLNSQKKLASVVPRSGAGVTRYLHAKVGGLVVSRRGVRNR